MTKSLLHILLASIVLSPCFADEITSRFDRIVPVKVPAWALSALNRKRFDIAEIEKLPQPRDWSVEWGSFSKNCRFYIRGSHWGISAPEKVTIYNTVLCRSLSRRYSLRLEAAAPSGSRAPTSSVAVGVFRYGLVNRGGMIAKEIDIKRGEDVSCDIPLRFDSGVPPFRVMLTVSGDVVLKKLTLRELPDDLARADITVIEGTLKERSILPDPKKSDYPDCRYTALLEGDSIIGGAPCQRNIQLVIDGFRNYKSLEPAKLKPGDKIRCQIVPFERLSDERKTVQQADDLNLFELPSFYALEIVGIPSFSESSAIMFTDRQEYVSVFERRINPPLSEETRRMQRQAVEDALAEIDRTLAPYSDGAALTKLDSRFDRAWKAEMARDPAGSNRIGRFVWRNVNDSFWALPARHRLVPQRRTLRQDKLDALLALRDFLNANGCQLMIGIIPNLYDISARVVNGEFRNVPDFSSAWLARELLKNGLEAVCVSDRLVKEFDRHPFAFFYPDNGHPSDTTQDIMTDVFSERLKRYGFPETLDGKRFSIDRYPHVYKDYKRYFFPRNCDIGANEAGTPYPCRRVLYDGSEVFPDPGSPILVLGNSFIQTPMNYPDSFPSLLASKMRMGIASYRIVGDGPLTTIVSSLFSHPEKFIKGKRVVVLMLGLGHFHTATRANNIRTMDRQMSLLSGKTPRGMLPLSGNVSEIPARFKPLGQVRCFAVPESGRHTVADAALPQGHGDLALVLPVCADSPCPARLKINGAVCDIPECFGRYCWNRIVVPAPKGTEHLTIEIEGAPRTVVALGDIQVFQ